MQQWKMPIVVALVSISAIALAWSNSRIEQSDALSLASMSPTDVTSTPTATPIDVDFQLILSQLDKRRFQAFNARDMQVLRTVNEPDSPQALRDETLMRKILSEELDVQIASSTIISVDVKSEKRQAKRVLLQVVDLLQEEKRYWNVTLSQDDYGQWRFFDVTRAQPSTH